MTESAGTPAAFFDVDNTFIRGASSYHVGRELFRRGFFGVRDLVVMFAVTARYLAFGESKEQIDKARSRALRILKGRTVAELVAIGEEVYDAVLELRVYAGAKRLLDEHIAAGHQVWLVTASPIEIGQSIAHRVGATGCLGTRAEHIDGIYTGRMIGDMMHGTRKAAAIKELAERENLDLAQSYAYGDSLNDLPMLNAVGHPSPINPDRRLRIHARDVGWPIREFHGKRRRLIGKGIRSVRWAGGAWAFGLTTRLVRRQIKKRFRL